MLICMLAETTLWKQIINSSIVYMRKGAFRGRKGEQPPAGTWGWTQLPLLDSVWVMGRLWERAVPPWGPAGGDFPPRWIDVRCLLSSSPSTQISARTYKGLLAFKAYRAGNYFTTLWRNMLGFFLKSWNVAISVFLLVVYQASKPTNRHHLMPVSTRFLDTLSCQVINWTELNNKLAWKSSSGNF